MNYPNSKNRAFTLIELLVVNRNHRNPCSNPIPCVRTGKGSRQEDRVSVEPQTNRSRIHDVHSGLGRRVSQVKATTTSQPQIDDADGSIEEPDLGSVFTWLIPYIQKSSPTDEAMVRQRCTYAQRTRLQTIPPVRLPSIPEDRRSTAIS